MSNETLVHVLQRGQILALNHSAAGEIVASNLQKMRLGIDRGNPYAKAYVTFVDERGVSLYITRGYAHGGDMKAFLPKADVAWQAYFQATTEFNKSYAGSGHFTDTFPLAFL